MCAKFHFSISSRCDDIVAEVKGGNYMLPPPPAAGGWRGDPADAGLTAVNASSNLHFIELLPFHSAVFSR